MNIYIMNMHAHPNTPIRQHTHTFSHISKNEGKNSKELEEAVCVCIAACCSMSQRVSICDIVLQYAATQFWLYVR